MSQKTVRAAAHSLRNITPPSASAPASRTASTLPPFDVPGRQQLDHVEQPSQPGLTSPRRALKLSPPTLVYEGPSHRRPIILNHHEPTPYRTGPTAGTMTIFEGPTHPGRQCQRPGVHSGKTVRGAGGLTPAANSWYVADVTLQAPNVVILSRRSYQE
ncbi:hypothetical protein B0H14DRAFT_2995759 [Mycena olivaceomarginata]|nr:hypothetical protein B0H14DRAFT_2995759 [Mycena olivaceomarginata]